MSVDTSQLPSDVQAMIAKAVADALAANAPKPPRELTPAEQATAGLAQLETALRADHAQPSYVYNELNAVASTLAILVTAVFPQPEPAPVDNEVA